MEMKKKKIIYSLTKRGLFSELSNLALAIVYAEYNNEELVVNTRNWNARVVKGWNDYFDSALTESQCLMCSQYVTFTKKKPWWGNIYYHPSVFFRYYVFYIMNRLYLLFHPETELGDDVFLKMRSKDFVEKHGDMKSGYSSILKKILLFNQQTVNYIRIHKAKLNLPDDYMAVHVRRGDKIVSCEMKEIALSSYIEAIKSKKHISRNVFIATDDISVIEEIKTVLTADGFHVYSNNAVRQTGFHESSFNAKSKETRYIDTLNMLLDMDIMIHSAFFIGTYTSNVSRIVPLYIGFENSLSLDEDWKL